MLDGMDTLDPDDPRPPFLQVVSILRAAILTQELQPGERLPSFSELAMHFGVAPMTIQKAIGILRDDGHVVTRQGRGSFVRQRTERSVGLRPHVEEAFETGGEVAIDFAGFSGETLHGVIAEPLDKIRAGRLTPSALRIRILLPDLTVPVGLPSLADGSDSPDVRKRAERITQRSTQAILDTVSELSTLGLVESASAQVRTFQTAPLFKLFLINGQEAFFGFYPVLKHSVAIQGEPVEIFDPMGKDAVLFHYAISDDETAIDSQYVSQAQTWFDSVWDSVAKDTDGAQG